MRKTLIILVVIGAGLAGWYWMQKKKQAAPPADYAPETRPTVAAE